MNFLIKIFLQFNNFGVCNKMEIMKMMFTEINAIWFAEKVGLLDACSDLELFKKGSTYCGTWMIRVYKHFKATKIRKF